MKKHKQSIAVIGSGISGLSASWLLHKNYDITLYEKNDYLGGHTHTHDVQDSSKALAVDSGFIVYNEKNYPNLVGLFKQLKVETQATDMSFAFSLDNGKLEYAGTGIKGMFAQFSNIFKASHWRLLKEIVRFNKTAHAQLSFLENNKKVDYSLGDFLVEHRFSKSLQHNYLLPMAAAIWSCPVEIMYKFPAFSFLRFFANHGLIDLKDRPQWRSVIGGSREYINKMRPVLEAEIAFRSAAKSVKRGDDHAEVSCSESTQKFDHVIFACHADEALALLDDPLLIEQDILTHFKYQKNETYLHTDQSLMPKRKHAWCSWNYLAQSASGDSSINDIQDKQVTATYWMNKLQKFEADKNYLVTLNPYQAIDPEKVIKKMTYHHPVFDKNAVSAQSRLHQIQGINKTWFCGSYAGYGFHEDGITSSVAVCEKLGVIAEWNQEIKTECSRHV